MPTIIQLDGAGLRRHAANLAQVLRDCVLHGASVGFLLPCPLEEAQAFWLALAPQVDSGAIDGEAELGLDESTHCAALFR